MICLPDGASSKPAEISQRFAVGISFNTRAPHVPQNARRAAAEDWYQTKASVPLISTSQNACSVARQRKPNGAAMAMAGETVGQRKASGILVAANAQSRPIPHKMAWLIQTIPRGSSKRDLVISPASKGSNPRSAKRPVTATLAPV